MSWPAAATESERRKDKKRSKQSTSDNVHDLQAVDSSCAVEQATASTSQIVELEKAHAEIARLKATVARQEKEHKEQLSRLVDPDDYRIDRDDHPDLVLATEFDLRLNIQCLETEIGEKDEENWDLRQDVGKLESEVARLETQNERFRKRDRVRRVTVANLSLKLKGRVSDEWLKVFLQKAGTKSKAKYL